MEEFFKMISQLLFVKAVDLYAECIAIVVAILGSNTYACGPVIALPVVRFRVVAITVPLTALAKDLMSSSELIKLLLPTPESPTRPTFREVDGLN